MRRSISSTLAVALALMTAASASAAPPPKAAPSIGDYLGRTEAEITRGLEQRRYRVREFEVEGGLLEVEATRGGKRDEIHIDARTGRIVDIEPDD